MIHILDWKYKTDGSLLDNVRGHDWETLALMANSLGLGISTLNRRIRSLKDEGKLKTYRYPNNNIIWCIGDDVKNLNNSYDVLATARFRSYLSKIIYIKLSQSKLVL